MKDLISYSLALFLFFSTGEIQGQSLDQAKQLYDQGRYQEAKPVFQRLVKEAPNNGSYNHWFGVCCFETGDLETALPHLEAAVKRKVQESYRYLAMLCFKTYHFDRAESLFAEYISLLEKGKQDVSSFILWKDCAAKAQRMVENVEWIQIIDSIVSDKDDFLHAYTLSRESGAILPPSHLPIGPADNISILYINQHRNKVFYARQTDGYYRIYTQSRLLEGWGDEKALPDIVNCGDDNNYPFVLSDGLTLYYASTANSLGGYDLFVTRYNTTSQSYLAPQQLPMPFNSIYNDYLIVFDETRQLGWFVSDRFQPQGKVCTYLFIIEKEKDEERPQLSFEEKRLRAIPLGISHTWTDSSLYPSLIRLARQAPLPDQESIKKEFEFIINHDLIYYTLDQIDNPQARKLYANFLTLSNQASQLQFHLDSLRLEYANGNTAVRQRLRDPILQTETRLQELLSQLPSIEKQARNTVIAPTP